MDGSTLEHSDSDSGESWTLLDNSPSYADDVPDGAADTPNGLSPEPADKDEDTDGISIISDSDPESTAPCELTYEHCALEEGPPAAAPPHPASADPPPRNNAHFDESIREDDFLGDNNGKLKTYVHRRNKRLSTVLNIIVLGSVITAAGVAVGHMWGARHECLHAAPAVHRILSNLYKLQEENALLRAKLKELSAAGGPARRRAARPPPHKCRKLFEEPLNSKNVDKLTKCVDNETDEEPLDAHLMQPQFEKDFLNDIDKLKNVYEQNKSWLDEEIVKRLKAEEQYKNKMKNSLKSPKSTRINEEHKTRKDENLRRQLATEPPINNEVVINVTEPSAPPLRIIEVVENKPEKKITYADSLKSSHKVVKRDINEATNVIHNDYVKKRKIRKEIDSISQNSLADDVVRKDDRYVSPRPRPERKKTDRQKAHKKQKRRNKYEQWEMKGGYMKDYDEFSIPSAFENEYMMKNTDKNHMSRDFERKNYINQFSAKAEAAAAVEAESRAEKQNQTGGDASWFEARAALRSEARRRLEQELMGPATGAPASARWYFRRMQRREQCRSARDNSTYRRLADRLRNYKTKH